MTWKLALLWIKLAVIKKKPTKPDKICDSDYQAWNNRKYKTIIPIQMWAQVKPTVWEQFPYYNTEI
jgi:hypothetical protein